MLEVDAVVRDALSRGSHFEHIVKSRRSMKFEAHLDNDEENASLLHATNGVATDLHQVGSRAFAIFEIVGVIHDPESVRVFEVDLDGELVFNHPGADFRAVRAAMELPMRECPGRKHANLLNASLRAAGQAGTATAIDVLNLRPEVASQD